MIQFLGFSSRMALAAVVQSWERFLASGATYRKETTAALYEKPSSSVLSHFALHDSLLRMDREPSLGADTYNLHDLVGGHAHDHKEVYEDVKRWLQQFVEQPRGTDIRTDKGLPKTRGLETTPNMRPDVFYTFNRGGNEVEEVLLIEIDSNTLKSTCRKLAYGLIEQLLRLRCFNDTIMECVGYYFPACSRATSVVRMEVTWEDEYLTFTVKRRCLSKREVVDYIQSDLMREVDRWRSITPGMPGKEFKVTLTSQFVHNSVGPSAHQISSGESVVIVDLARSKVFKHNFVSREFACALRLLNEQQTGKVHLERSLLPLEQVQIGGVHYLTYQLLLKPLSRAEARALFGGVDGFASGVVRALHELHDRSSLAHLDLRLENVCFEPDSHRAILIDLDRSGPKNHPFEKYNLPPASTMYTPPDTTWALEKVDLMQLGLMFCYILDDSTDLPTFHYHSYNPATVSRLHPYLLSLLHGTWPSATEQDHFCANPTFLLSAS